MLTVTILLLSSILIAALSSPLRPITTSTQDPIIVPSLWDRTCFYPTPTPNFKLHDYLGRWYQVAGTLAPFTAGCSCIQANYALNDNGTVNVFNSCQIGNQRIAIEGTASPANPKYGSDGVFRVEFPGQAAPGDVCPGPNYIVQQFEKKWAIVQTANFSTLFLLSREQNPKEDFIDFWLNRAEKLGSNLRNVVKTEQRGCLVT